MGFIGQSSLQTMYQTEHSNLNDPSGVHISGAGASGICDIILDYVKSPVEGQYTNQNTKKKVSEVQHQPQLLQTNNNKKFQKPF